MLAAACACTGPLDRRDGALIIELVDVPAQVDELAIEVHAGGRTFALEIARPPNDRITAFSAVPAGSATLDLRLFAGGLLVATKLGMPVEVVEGATEVVTAAFALGPEIVIDDPAVGASHHVADGFVALTVRAVDPALPTRLTVEVGGTQIEALPTARGWFAMIDPALAGPILPAPLDIELEACVIGAGGLCSQHARSVEIHRRAWLVDLGAVAAARPTVAHSAVIIGDESGALHVLEQADGQARFAAVQLAAPLSLPAVDVGGQVAVVDGANVLSLVALDTGARSPWQRALGADRPTAPAFDRGSIIVAAGRRVLQIDPADGSALEIASTAAVIRAPPLADPLGLVVVDVAGHVVVLDAAGAVAGTTSLEAAVIAQPARDGADAIVATVRGHVFRIASDASAVSLADLGAPVVHAPLVLGDHVVVAAGEEVAWVSTAGVTRRRLPAPITGAPAAWGPEPGVVVGLRSGLVVALDSDGALRVIARLEGAALSPAVVGTEIAVAGSRGVLDLLKPEEGL